MWSDSIWREGLQLVNASFNDFSPWKVLIVPNRAHPNFLKALEFLSLSAFIFSF